MSHLIGFNPLLTVPNGLEGKDINLGARTQDDRGNEWIYVQAGSGGITGAGRVCTVTTAYVAVMLSTSNDLGGDIVGVAGAAFAVGERGWLQVKGPCSIRVAASCAANVRLNTTATGGQVDDDGTAGAFAINGMFLSVANGGVAGNAAGFLNYPQLSAAAI